MWHAPSHGQGGSWPWRSTSAFRLVSLAAAFEAAFPRMVTLPDFLALFRPTCTASDAEHVLQQTRPESATAFAPMLLFALRHDLLEPVRTYLFQRPAAPDVSEGPRLWLPPATPAMTDRAALRPPRSTCASRIVGGARCSLRGRAGARRPPRCWRPTLRAAARVAGVALGPRSRSRRLPLTSCSSSTWMRIPGVSAVRLARSPAGRCVVPEGQRPSRRLAAYYRGEHDVDEIVWLEGSVPREHVFALEAHVGGDLLFVQHP